MTADVSMSRSSRVIQKECGRLIHILQKKQKTLEMEVARMRLLIEAEEQTFSPNGEPLSPRLSVQPRSPQNLDWQDVKSKNPQRSDDMDLAHTLRETKKKFDELDRNSNGSLEGSELLALSDWCWSHFPVCDQSGKPVSKGDRKQAATDLLEQTDQNRDGKVDFDEFAVWFVRFVSKTKKKKYEDSSEDGHDEPEVTSASAVRALTPPSNSMYNRSSNRNQNRASASPQARTTTVSPAEQVKRRRDWQNTKMGKKTKDEPKQTYQSKSPFRRSEEPKKPVVASVSLNHKFSLSSPSKTQQVSSVSPSKPGPSRSPMNPVRTSPVLPKKKVVRRQRTNEVEEPWMVLANFKTPAKNRVQLFLRLNTNRDNKLGEKEIRPMLIKCGIPNHRLDSMLQKFSRHFGSSNGSVTFKQFEQVIPSDANEREIFKIVSSLNRTE